MKKIFFAFAFLSLSSFAFCSHRSTSGQIAQVSFNPQNPKGLMIHFQDGSCTFRPESLLLKENFWFRKLQKNNKTQTLDAFVQQESDEFIREIFLLGTITGYLFTDKAGFICGLISLPLFKGKGQAFFKAQPFAASQLNPGDKLAYQIQDLPKKDYPLAKIQQVVQKARLRTESSSSSASQ